MFLMCGPELMKEKKTKKEKKDNKDKKDRQDKRKKEEKDFVLYPDDMSLADLSLKPVISI
jgi:hypothetical protein